MNRLIFIKFLEDKGLVPRGLLKKTYKEWKEKKIPASYYDTYLKPLFYEVLNTPEDERSEHTLGNERDSNEKTLNPDILGHVYEKLINLLTSEGQKGLGAYYTPDEITSFIAKATIEPILVERLKKVLRNWGWPESTLKFNTLDEVLNEDRPITRDGRILGEFLDEINKIRILDPAVGSGHFLVSALKEILQIKKRIYSLIGKDVDLYKLKLEIILNNLYGVDIDDTAVEVAKLRLWLALIEDLDIEAVRKGEVVLPNMEYNIWYGNSLVGWLNEKLMDFAMIYPYDKKIAGIFMGLKAATKGEEAVRSKKLRIS